MMVSLVLVIAQVRLIASLMQLYESSQHLVFPLFFRSTLETVIDVYQYEDQSCDNESQGSHYETEKQE